MTNLSVTKRLILFLVVSLFSIGLGFFLPSQWVAPAFHHSGYYFMLIAFVLWGMLIIDVLKEDFLVNFRKHAPALLLAVVLVTLIFQMSPPKFKILADETNLISVSMAMHKMKTASMLLEGLAVEYHSFDYNQHIDPRPLFYPFVVSLSHAVLGYSPYNGIVINFLCGIGILFLIYMLFSFVFSRFFGFVAMIITASFPIFIFWVTSSGFETINLFFIIVVFLVLFLFLKHREVKYAELVLISLVLLANCRYESALFFLPLFLLVPYFLNRHIITEYRLYTLCLPLFFLPLAWQRQVFFLESSVLGDSGLLTPDHVFRLSSFMDNFPQNVFAMSGLNVDQGFLFLVFIAAVAGFYFSIKKFLFNHKSIGLETRLLGIYIGTSGFLLFVLYTSFFWGQFTTDINNRLAVAMLPFIIFPAMYYIYRFFQQRNRQAKFLLMFLLIVHMIYYWPVAADHRLLKENALHYVNHRVTHYLYENYDLDNEKLLLISDRPYLFVIHGMGSIGFQNAVQNQKKLHYLDNVYYDHMLVLQRCNPIDSEVQPDNRLSDAFQLKEIYRINVSKNYYIRISKASLRRSLLE